MATAKELLDAEEREQARLDLLAERMAQPAAEQVDELLHNPTNRDEQLWLAAGIADVEVTIDDYEDVPVDQRDALWVAGLAAMLAAAKLQVLAEDREGLLRAFARRLRDVNGLDLDQDELISAATQGISKKNVAALTKQLRDDTIPDSSADEVLDATSLAELRALDNADFIDSLQDSRMIGSWGAQQARHLANAERMLELEPGSDHFRDEKSSAIGAVAGLGILLLLRRASQQYTTLVEVNGNDETLMIWITEDDEAVCENCDPRGGMIHTYAEWRALGLPGSAVCLGKDRCRCDLFKIPGDVGQAGELRGRVITEAKAERAAARLIEAD